VFWAYEVSAGIKINFEERLRIAGRAFYGYSYVYLVEKPITAQSIWSETA